MLIGITTGGKVGLGITALVLVAFALTASFLLPRRNPDFPGEHLRGFIWLTILLFVALMAAVVVFAKEGEEEEAAGAGGEATATQVETETGAGEEEPVEEEPTEEEPAEEGNEGDAAAGEAVFAANGCGGCHTLEAAGSSGDIGPNLDQTQPDFDLAVGRVTNGQGVMPAFGGDLSEEEISNVAAFVVESTNGG